MSHFSKDSSPPQGKITRSRLPPLLCYFSFEHSLRERHAFGAMKILSGRAKDKRLCVPPHLTRPTTSRVREAVFNTLMPILPGARVLDLFAGSGALGFEALSRGAASAVLVDQSSQAASAIQKNQKSTQLPAQLIKQEVHAFLRVHQAHYSLIFLDPPYDSSQASDLLTSPDLWRVLDDDGWLVIETKAFSVPKKGKSKEQFFLKELHNQGLESPLWELIKHQSYGNTLVLIYQKKGNL